MSPVEVSTLLILLQTGLLHAGSLDGKHLRVGYLERPPDVFFEFSKEHNTTVLRGVLINMLEWMSIRGNFTYTLVPLDYKEGFNGLPKEFEEKKLDMALNSFGFRHGRNLVANYLYPTGQVEHALIIPFPRSEANVWSVFLPYTWTVWLCLVVSAVAMIFLLNGVARFQRYFFGSADLADFLTLGGTSEYVIGVASNQGGTCSSKAWAVRLLAGTWCLASVILVNAFSGSLITHLTIPTITPLVSALRDLANRSEPRMLTRAESLIRTQFETSSIYSAFRDNVMRYPRDFCGQIHEEQMDQCLSLVKKGSHVLSVESGIADVILVEDFNKTKTCELTLVEETFEKTYAASVIPLSSSHHLRNSLDVLVMDAISYGFLSKWESEQHPTKSTCTKYRRFQPNALRRLSLGDLSSAFVILGVGIAPSLVAFLYRRFKNGKR